MPVIDEGSYDTDDRILLGHEDNYSEVIRHFRQKTMKSGVNSLMSMTGLQSATEAYFFFQELQAALASIRILGLNVDELWCRLDWCSLIMGMWVRRKGHRGGHSMDKWMSIMESWQFIIESTASMAVCFALPSGHTQRVALYDDKRNVTSDRMFRAASCYGNSSEEDKKLMVSVLKAARLHDWSIPLRHDRPFRTMIARARSTLEKDFSKRMLLQQRRRGIEASEFEEFVADIEKETYVLLGFLTSEEKEDLGLAFVRVFEATLSVPAPSCDIRYLQVCQKIRSQWLSSDETLQERVGESFQKQVQETFYSIVTRKPSKYDNKPMIPIDKDLSDVLALGADIRGDLEGTTNPILHVIASLNCPLRSFKTLITAGAPYTNDPKYDATPLHAAAGANNIDVMAFLLDRRLHSFAVVLNLSDEEGQTALHWAARNCCTEAVDVLLRQSGINIDVEDRRGFTPFLLAAKHGGVAVMSRLLQTKNVNCYHLTHWYENALHFAADRDDNSLSYVLRYVKNVNARSESGKTPLHNAVEQNSGRNVSILLRNGADPSIVDDHCFTPFARACQEHHLGPMKLFLKDSRSLVELFSSPHESFGCRYGDDSFEHPSPVTLVHYDLQGAGKLRLARIHLALKIILAVKPNLEVRDREGRSVLSKVIKNLNAPILQDILRAGADVSSRDYSGKSILHKAIKAEDANMLQILLRAGAGTDVNSQDHNGNTPMHKLLGRYFGNVEKLRILLEWGADPDIKNDYGEDPVTANLERRDELWSQDPRPIIREHRLQLVKARKALAKAEKRKHRRFPLPKRPKLSNPFSALTLEGEE